MTEERSLILGINGEETVKLALCKAHFNSERTRGVDFLVKYRGLQCYVEVKNWANYGVTEQMFNEKILDRFIKADPAHKGFWILTINKRIAARKSFKQFCKKYSITVIPLEHHITNDILFEASLLYITLDKLVKHFIKLRQGLYYLSLLYFLLRRVRRMLLCEIFGVSYDTSMLRIAKYAIREGYAYFYVLNTQSGSFRVVSLNDEGAHCTCPYHLYTHKICRHIQHCFDFIEIYDPEEAKRYIRLMLKAAASPNSIRYKAYEVTS